MKFACLLCITLIFGTTARTQTFAWAVSMGGTQTDRGYSIVTDASGNIYTTGMFSGTVDFDPGPGVYNMSSGIRATSDMFLQKLDANGNFIWAKQLVGDSSSAGYGMALDGSSNIYITGYFWGTKDFDPGAGIFNLTGIGSAEIYVLKLDNNGNFIWVKQMGGSGPQGANAIALDLSGNIFVTGRYQSTMDSDPGPGVYNLTSNGGYDIYIFKLDNNGNFLWANSIGGAAIDYSNSITTDVLGNLYAVGSFAGTVDFDPGSSAYNLTAAARDIFIWKLGSGGNFLWAKQMVGNSSDQGTSIVSDASSNLYYTGSFSGMVDFDPGPGTLNLTSSTSNYIVSKLDASGTLVWAKQVPGSPSQGNTFHRENGIAIDAGGNIYTTGQYQGYGNFDPGNPVYSLPSIGANDIFVQKLDNAGNFIWAVSMGGAGDDNGIAITVNSTSQVYTTGGFRNTVDFDPGTGVSNLTSAGNDDIFIQKLIQVPCLIPSQPLMINGSSSVCQNSSQTYFISAVTGATSYSWTLPSGWTGSSTTTSITTTAGNNSGNISVTANNSCGSSNVQSLAVTVSTAPAQPGSITGNNSVCSGSSQTYSISAVTGATSYSWTVPSGWTGSSTTNSITTTAGSNSGNISVTANNGCGSSIAQTFAVNVNTSPAQPAAITGNIAVVTGQAYSYSITPVSGATGYTWSLNGGGTITTGQNTASISINWLTAANYILSVNATNSCGASSNQTLNITVSIATGFANPDNQFKIQVTPNPSPGYFYLEAKGVSNKTIKIEVINFLGQTVYSSQQKSVANDYYQRLDMQSLSDGTYKLRIVIDKKIYVRTIVKID